MVTALYNPAAKYVEEYGLKTSKNMARDIKDGMDEDREEWAMEVYTSFGGQPDITNYNSFAWCACGGAIVNQAGADGAKVRKVNIIIAVALGWYIGVADFLYETSTPTFLNNLQDTVAATSS